MLLAGHVVFDKLHNKKKYHSKKDYVCKHYTALKEHLEALRKDLPRCAGKSLNAGVVNRILEFGVPETMVKVCFRGVQI